MAADAVALMTDLPRLRQGHVGAQFWSVFVPMDVKGSAGVQMTLEQMTLEQIDLLKSLCLRYPTGFGMACTAADIERLRRAHRIASLIGVEGGRQINNSLPVLRAY